MRGFKSNLMYCQLMQTLNTFDGIGTFVSVEDDDGGISGVLAE